MRSEAKAAALLAAGLVVAGAVFVLAPQIDLGASRLFYDGTGGFLLGGARVAEYVRDLIWNLSILTFLLAVAGLVRAAFGRRLLGLGWRHWGFVAALYLFGPVLLVNGILKEYWGRARPADVREFGGDRVFSPPWPPSDQCLSNCSFVSGEVSSAVVLAIVMLMLRPGLARQLPGMVLHLWTAVAVILPVLVIFQRIAAGRHFLSDALFATLFMLALALVLRLVFRLGHHGSS
jgi:lipid A 4'-phosphatase